MAESPTLPGEDIAWLDAGTLARSYRDGRLSPVDVANALVERVRAVNPTVNAIVHLDPAATLTQAREAEARYRAGSPLSPLDGVPVTIKDLSAVKGWPRRRGSLATDPAPSPEDTPCVARMREAGMVFLAKTATPEGGCKVVTSSPVHGHTANPYDRSRTPGGSSGGAAAALALGFGPLALGSDGAGSIRIPASSTNLFGLKPGFGRVPAYPPDIDMPMSVVGPMSRSVADACLMLAVIGRPEPRDPFAWPLPFTSPADLDDPDLKGLRIAVSPRLGMTAPLVDGRVDALVAEAGPLLADAGASVVAEDPVWPEDPFLAFRIFWESACMAGLDAVPPERRDLVDPLIRAVAAEGRKLSLSDYLHALERRMVFTAAAHAFFTRYDLLVGPVMPVPPYAIGRDVPEGFANEDWRWCPYTHPWNMSGQPAASVPIGFVDGLPIGVQIIGRKGGEDTILRAAAAIERRRPLHRIHPSLFTFSQASKETTE